MIVVRDIWSSDRIKANILWHVAYVKEDISIEELAIFLDKIGEDHDWKILICEGEYYDRINKNPDFAGYV